MKKKIIIIGLLILMAVGVAYARMNVAVIGIAGMVAGGACETVIDSQGTATATSYVGSDNTNNVYYGLKNYTSSVSICSIEFQVYDKTGTGAVNWSVGVFSRDGDNLDELLYQSNTIAHADIATSAANLFTFNSDIPAGTYHIALISPGNQADYVRVETGTTDWASGTAAKWTSAKVSVTNTSVIRGAFYGY